MKTKDIKRKVAAKVAKGKAKVARKTGGKVAKTCAAIVAAFALAAVCGCATADAPTAQRAQHSVIEDNEFHIVAPVGAVSVPAVTNYAALAALTPEQIAAIPVAPLIHIEIGNQAQANDTSGTETTTATATQTPTNDVKPETHLTYGLAGGGGLLENLTDTSLRQLSAWLRSGKANGEMTVTKKDGTTETVTCKDGNCTTSSGAVITCTDCGI